MMRSSSGNAKQASEPTGREWWLGYAALIAPAMLLLIGKGEQAEATDSSLPSQILWISAYVLAARSLWRHSAAFKYLVRHSIVLWLLVGMFLLSTLWSVDAIKTFKDAIELVGTTLIACYFVVRYTLGRFMSLVAAAYGTIAVCSMITVVVAPGRGRDDWGSGPWCGVYQDKNNLGAAMAMAILAFVMLLLTPAGRKKAQNWGGALLSLLLLLGASSVTALSSLIVASVVGFTGLACRAPRLGRIVTTLVLSCTSIVVAVFAVVGVSPDAFIGALGRSSTLTGRTDFWPYVIQAIGDRPFLGYGYKAFFESSVGRDYLSYYIVESGGWSPYHAHDSFLQISLDIGLVGAGILALLLLIGLFRGAVFLGTAPRPEAAWPIMVVIYITVGSYTETYLANFNSPEWIFFVAALLYPVRPRGMPILNSPNLLNRSVPSQISYPATVDALR